VIELYDVLLALGGLVAGLMVGLTGMGGAVLVTPLLIVGFGVPAAAAVSSDVVAGAVVKPVGSLVHARRGTVHWGLALWLSGIGGPGLRGARVAALVAAVGVVVVLLAMLRERRQDRALALPTGPDG
jgi:uncharacterized membrane protein YfcA